MQNKASPINIEVKANNNSWKEIQTDKIHDDEDTDDDFIQFRKKSSSPLREHDQSKGKKDNLSKLEMLGSKKG